MGKISQRYGFLYIVKWKNDTISKNKCVLVHSVYITTWGLLYSLRLQGGKTIPLSPTPKFATVAMLISNINTFSISKVVFV